MAYFYKIVLLISIIFFPVNQSFALTEQVPLSLVAFGPSLVAILILSGILLHIEDG